MTDTTSHIVTLQENLRLALDLQKRYLNEIKSDVPGRLIQLDDIAGIENIIKTNTAILQNIIDKEEMKIEAKKSATDFLEKLKSLNLK